MYLTRLLLNPLDKNVRRDIAHPYEFHRTVMRAFECAPPDNRVLFRIEGLERTNSVDSIPVLVQSSAIPPDWHYAFRSLPNYCLHYVGPKEIHPQPVKGARYAFRLVANPTKKILGKRVPLIHEADVERNGQKLESYYSWLTRKGQLHGFSILHVVGSPFHLSRNPAGRVSHKARIPHFGVRFDGVLTVVDAEKVAEALERGIGPAKAFGFGLLTLAPI